MEDADPMAPSKKNNFLLTNFPKRNMDQFPTKSVVFSIQDYVDERFRKELAQLNNRIREIMSNKLDLIESYNKFYTSYLEEIAVTFKTTGQESYTKIFPKTRTNVEREVKIDPMLKLAMTNLKNEFVVKGYKATFDCEIGRNGDYCEAGYIFTVYFF